MTWFCPKCFRRNSDDAEYCTRCGRSKDQSNRDT